MTNEYLLIGEIVIPYKSLTNMGNLLRIQLAEEIDEEKLNSLDFSVFDFYNRYDSKIGTYVGYSTVYRYNDGVLLLSNDGSKYIAPRDYQYIVINDSSSVDVKSVTQKNNLLEIKFVNVDDVITDDLKESVITLYSSINSEYVNSYHGYKTIYKINGTTLLLSNDGSKYTPPRDHEFIRVNDGSSIDVINVIQNGNILEIKFLNDPSIPNDMSEICYYSVDSKEIASFTGFTTIYNIIGNTVYLSNDGSKYQPPRSHDYIRIDDGLEFYVNEVLIDNNKLNISFIFQRDAKACTGGNVIAYYSRQNEEIKTFTGFTTLFRIVGKDVQLSDDGTTYDEDKMILEELESKKENKIRQMSDACNQAILGGVSIAIKGQNRHFSYTLEDQQNIKATFDLVKMTKMDIPYHADNESCELFTAQEITELYVAEQLNLFHNQIYFNQLKCFIESLNTLDDIEVVQYGQSLTGDYLNTYNEMMKQTNAVIIPLAVVEDEEITIGENNPDGNPVENEEQKEGTDNGNDEN